MKIFNKIDPRARAKKIAIWTEKFKVTKVKMISGLLFSSLVLFVGAVIVREGNNHSVLESASASVETQTNHPAPTIAVKQLVLEPVLPIDSVTHTPIVLHKELDVGEAFIVNINSLTGNLGEYYNLRPTVNKPYKFSLVPNPGPNDWRDHDTSPIDIPQDTGFFGVMALESGTIFSYNAQAKGLSPNQNQQILQTVWLCRN